MILRLKSNYYGKAGECKPCKKRRTANWQKDNPDKVSFYAAKSSDTRQVRAYNKRMSAERAAVEAEAVRDGHFTPNDWIGLKRLFDDGCAYCQEPCDKPNKEHVLAHVNGGKFDRYNIIPSCKSCNSSKGKKILWEEWLPCNPHSNLTVLHPKE